GFLCVVCRSWRARSFARSGISGFSVGTACPGVRVLRALSAGPLFGGRKAALSALSVRAGLWRGSSGVEALPGSFPTAAFPWLFARVCFCPSALVFVFRFPVVLNAKPRRRVIARRG